MQSIDTMRASRRNLLKGAGLTALTTTLPVGVSMAQGTPPAPAAAPPAAAPPAAPKVLEMEGWGMFGRRQAATPEELAQLDAQRAGS